MADIWRVLYCFGCERNAVQVNKHWKKAKLVKCRNRGREDTICSIEGAMKAAGKEPMKAPTPATKAS